MVRALSGQSVTVEVEDCGHNKVQFTFTAPQPSESELVVQPGTNPNPPAGQQPAGPYVIVERVYQGYWTAGYELVPQSGNYTCNPDKLESVFWSLQFYSDNRIVMHHCQGDKDVKTDCYLEFQQDKNNYTRFVGITNPGYVLEFRNGD
jgi:hypothetical protein